MSMTNNTYPAESFSEFKETYKSRQYSSLKEQDYTCLPNLRVYPPKVEFNSNSQTQVVTLMNNNSYPVKLNRLTVTHGYQIEYDLPEFIRPTESVEVSVKARGNVEVGSTGYLMVFLDQEKGLFAAELYTEPF